MNCDCDYEPSTVWASKMVRAKKPWRCTECNGTIPVGETYERIGSLFDGSWSTFRLCGDCRVAICDMGKATESQGGCFCYAAGYLMGEMADTADDSSRDEQKILLPIFAAFNAASKARGGRLFDLDLRFDLTNQ